MSSTNRKRYIFDYEDGLHRFIHSGDLPFDYVQLKYDADKKNYYNI